MSANSTKRIAVAAIGIAASVFFLALALRSLNLAQVQAAVAHAAFWPWAPLAMLSYLVGHLVRGWRCRLLVSREANLALTTASNVVVVGYAVNNILPARMGELARAGMLSERTGLPYAQSLTVTLLERLLDAIVMVALLAIAAWSLPIGGMLGNAARAIALVLTLAALGVMVAVVAPQWLTSLASRVGALFGERVRNTAIKLCVYVANGVAFLRDPRHAVSVISLTFVVWLFETGMFFFVLPAFGLPLNFQWALFAMSVTNLGILVPSSPGFVGTFHAACAAALAQFGISETVAFSYAVVVHLTFYVPITLWGVLVIFWYGFELRRSMAMAEAAKSATSFNAASRGDASVLLSIRTAAADENPSPFYLSLIEAILPLDEFALGEKSRAEVVRRCAAFTNTSIRDLPGIVAILFTIATTGFRVVTAMMFFRPFTMLSLETRRKVVNFWAYGPIPLTRQMFRALRSTALLAFFENPEVIAMLDARAHRVTPVANESVSQRKRGAA